MSIQYTYDELTAVVKSFSEDNDPEYVSNIDDFIAKGETRCLRDLELETFEQWLEVTVSGSDRVVAKPSGVIEVNDLWVRDPSDQQWMECPRRSFEYCLAYATSELVLGVPQFYSEYDENNIYVVPTPDQTYSSGNARVRATIRPAGLGSTVSTTFLSLHFADLLFQAVMIEAYDFLKHEKKVQSSAQKYQSLVPSLSKEIEDIVRKHYKGLNKTQQGADD